MKKTLALLLVVFTLIAQLSMVTVSADGATVTVETVEAAAGETVDVKVDLGNCAGFANLMLEFEYDSALTLVGATNGITGLTPTTSKNLTDEPYVMLWESNTNTVYSGTIVTFQFKVADNAVAGKYDIKVAAGKGPTGDFEDGYDCNYDENFDDINLSYFNGSIHVAGGDDPAPTEYALDAVVAGNGVEITAEGPAMDGKIIAALYNGKKLAQVKIFDAAADLSATFTNTGDKIKVMWWDGMLTAKPLCDSVELPLN